MTEYEREKERIRARRDTFMQGFGRGVGWVLLVVAALTLIGAVLSATGH